VTIVAGTQTFWTSSRISPRRGPSINQPERSPTTRRRCGRGTSPFLALKTRCIDRVPALGLLHQCDKVSLAFGAKSLIGLPPRQPTYPQILRLSYQSKVWLYSDVLRRLQRGLRQLAYGRKRRLIHADCAP